MSSTLKDRVVERMAAMALTNAQVASACRVSAPTAFNWASGKTKKMKAEPLLLAAALFKVNAEWLASGAGPKFPAAATGVQPVIEQPVPLYVGNRPLDKWTASALAIMSRLDDTGKAAVLARIKEFVRYLDPPRHGQTLSMAAKNEGAA